MTLRYPVRTERLLLRPLTAADTDDLVAYRSIPEVCRYVPFEPMTAAVVRERIAGMWARHQLTDEAQALTLGIELAGGTAAGRVIGDVILFWHSCLHGAGEVGWVVHPAFAGRGYATEAAHAMLEIAFGEIGMHRVVARVDSRNVASLRVAARLGMRQEAHLVENEWFKGEWTDEVDYALLDREWPAVR